ncbi:MAG: CocE/NonD family hydrolase [Acidobacteria bacterium]|nr:CocE/NonD family hydrolase [Acidobacteriota bacterium]
MRVTGFSLFVLTLASALPSAAQVVQEKLRIPMRDGVRLAANLFRLKGSSASPVILVRTPYNKGAELSRAYRPFVEAGYAIVVEDVRGRFESEGVFDPLNQEPGDGEDTLNWLARQPWSNGRIGMTGGSYLGIVQWKAALTGNPYLKAIFPVVSGYDDYVDRAYSKGGAMKLGNRLLWMSSNLRAPGFTPPEFNFFVKHLPLRDADRAATGQNVDMYQRTVEHPAYDSFWKAISTREKLARIKVPVFSVGGWYDNFVDSDLEAFASLRKLGRTAHTMIGPWPHNMSIPFEGIDYGPDSKAPVTAIQLEWFARWLKGESAKAQFRPLRIFVMGANRWREEREWPLARAVPTPMYLASRQGANGVEGDGALRPNAPRRQRSDRFVYDPANPVPTRGGNTCCTPKIFAWGPMDQTTIEKRTDVLVYTGPALDKDLEVTGPVKVVLHVATSAKDTDFTAKLVDAYPDGRVVNLTDGILRLRYREGLERSVPAEPGKVYTITVDAGVTSNVFHAGHRIRLEVSSSNFPRFDRNLNTGGPHGMETRWQTAEQTVFHGGERPSHVLLPVVPQ